MIQYPENGRTVGVLVKQLRRQQQLTIKQLADKAGIDSATVSRVERGEQMPSIITAFQIAEGLNLSLYEFINKLGVECQNHEPNSIPMKASIKELERFYKLSEQQLNVLLDVAKSIQKNFTSK